MMAKGHQLDCDTFIEYDSVTLGCSFRASNHKFCIISRSFAIQLRQGLERRSWPFEVIVGDNT